MTSLLRIYGELAPGWMLVGKFPSRIDSRTISCKCWIQETSTITGGYWLAYVSPKTGTPIELPKLTPRSYYKLLGLSQTLTDESGQTFYP